MKQTLKPIQLKQNWEKKLADIHTPVGLYLKLRDRFPQALLLESADYHGKENAMSYICLEPWAEFKVENEKVFLNLYLPGRVFFSAVSPSFIRHHPGLV